MGLGRLAFGPTRARWALLIVFPLVYFSVMATSYQIYGRYTLPLLPFACTLAAIGLTGRHAGASCSCRCRARRRSSPGCAAGRRAADARSPTSVAFDRDLGRTSTIDRAYRWIRGNVEPGTKVAIETRALLCAGQSLSVDQSANARRQALRGTRRRVVRLSRGLHRQLRGDLLGARDAGRSLCGVSGSARTRRRRWPVFRPSEAQPGPTLRIFKFKQGP